MRIRANQRTSSVAVARSLLQAALRRRLRMIQISAPPRTTTRAAINHQTQAGVPVPAVCAAGAGVASAAVATGVAADGWVDCGADWVVLCGVAGVLVSDDGSADVDGAGVLDCAIVAEGRAAEVVVCSLVGSEGADVEDPRVGTTGRSDERLRSGESPGGCVAADSVALREGRTTVAVREGDALVPLPQDATRTPVTTSVASCPATTRFGCGRRRSTDRLPIPISHT